MILKNLMSWNTIALLVMAGCISAPASDQPNVTTDQSFDGPAELPREYVNSSLKDTPAGGKTWMVHSGESLEPILGKAACGDVIQLQAGASFSGNVVVPAKNCDDSHWIILRTSAPDASLPAEGTRLTPCYAGTASLPGRPAFNCKSSINVLARVEFNGGGAS